MKRPLVLKAHNSLKTTTTDLDDNILFVVPIRWFQI